MNSHRAPGSTSTRRLKSSVDIHPLLRSSDPQIASRARPLPEPTARRAPCRLAVSPRPGAHTLLSGDLSRARSAGRRAKQAWVGRCPAGCGYGG
jgi:hypothetical protein